MTEWFRPADFVAVSAGEIPTEISAFNRYVLQHGWRRDRRRARVSTEQGGGWEYHVTLAPIEIQDRLRRAPEITVEAPSKPIWQLFERLPAKAKEEAARRLAAIDRVDDLARASSRTTAVAMVADDLQISQVTLFRWLKLAAKVDRADRLAALAPHRQGRTATAECDPRAWDYVVAEYMRAECPRFEAIFRRLQDVASQEGWAPIPHCKTLKRRIEKEIPAAARVAARQGPDALKRLYPAQERDRSHLGPLQAVDIDGHKLDVFVAVPGMDKPQRVILIALHDLGTNLIVGWNLDLSETRDSTRLAIADMVERYGIPDDIYLDNGRGFASKLISGQQPSRFRFKFKADEPLGILTQLGIRTHWTNPYSGQSKPIERVFKDFCEEIAKHPICAGAYTGNTPQTKPHNYGSKAIPFADLEALCRREIERHNNREGRTGLGMNKRSFMQVWNDKIAEGAMVRRGSEEQLRMLLLASEAITIRRDQPAIHFQGNRYWSEALIGLAGDKVMIKFDPRALWEPVAVYGLDGRFVGMADCIEQTGFDDTEAARAHNKTRRAWMKAQKDAAALHQRLSLGELQRFSPAPTSIEPDQPKVIRLAAAVGAGRGPMPEITNFAEAFGAGDYAQDAADILPFRPPEQF